MRRIEITDRNWDHLLSLRGGAGGFLDRSDPVQALYGPVAAAAGSFVLAQVGQSLDGRIATPAGDARDISGPDGLAHLHRCRALVDAVIVGVGTVKADDPRLSVRIVKGPDPVRVVIDCRSELTGSEGIFNDSGAPVIVIQSREARCRNLPNAEVIKLPLCDSGLDPDAILSALAERSLSRVLVEGGARTIARFIEAGRIDHLHVAISPIIIGSGPSGISLPPIEKLTAAKRPAAEVYSLGSDILFDCCLKPAGSDVKAGEKVRVTDLA
ncbi:RibD family protein [Rhizobium halophytocola]|uniref:Riboflavin-specific deaminase-like protein n=1 Tax=Rhizobium halophytocola TaxID=735519 RepID=A0ABS4DUY5_9HYPH|nr:RibD family protein [Rhizobium halophytocola]MBP1849485.1 riboflavin-specific deaminase-like protein [Rhizobium halophytocola]